MPSRIIAVALTLVATAALSAPKQKLVLLNLIVSEKSMQALAVSTSELVSTELGRSGRFDVISQSDVATMLGRERQRQLLGCATDGADCLAELSAAFGSKWLVTGSLARLGKKLRLDLKVINTETSSTPYRDGRTFKNQEDLFEGAAAMVRELVAREDLWGVPAPEVKAAPPAAVTAPEAQPVAVASTASAPGTAGAPALSWVVVGVGGAAFLVGAVFAALATSDFVTLGDPGYAPAHTWTQVKATTDDFNRSVLVGSVLLGAGAAVLVAGLVWRELGHGSAAPVAISFTTSGLLVAGSF
jgi:TolB-like protein